MWLVVQDYNTFCEDRRLLAAYLMSVVSIQQVDKDITTPKLIILFEADVERAAETGLLSAELHGILRAAFNNLCTDSQEIEGVNSILRRIVTLAPSIRQPLLSSRILVKKHLNYLSADCKSKHEEKAAREGLVTAAVHGHHFASRRLADAELEKAAPNKTYQFNFHVFEWTCD